MTPFFIKFVYKSQTRFIKTETMEMPVELPIKVLYVEDDLIDQKAFQRYINNGHFNLQYELASSVGEAKQMLTANGYDVVVTDYLLNHETAFAIIDTIKNIPVIFITGKGDQEVAVKAMKKGVFDYIVKETSGNYLELLVTTIKKAHSYNTTHKKLEEAELEIKKFLGVLSQVDNGITILSKEGKIEWVNKGFEKLFGYTLEEVKNKSIDKFRRKGMRKSKFERLFMNSFYRKDIFLYESKIKSKLGRTYWIYTTITPIFDDLHNVIKVIIVDTDITEKKKIEQDLIKAKEKAETAAISKQQFLANMSHEIRTPINAIMGIMHMLENTEHPETRKKYIQLVNYASNNLLNIINDILDISKLEVGKMVLEKVDFNIEDLVNNIKKSMSYRAEEKGLRFTCHIFKDVPRYLFGDATRLNQILMNLVGNAIKFTGKGAISITVKAVSKLLETVKILFIVKDTGIGIAKAEQLHIFEYFHQAHAEATRLYGGTGLGLAIVKRLTEIQKGKVWFKSKENEGSEFFVELEFEIGLPTKIEEANEPPNTETLFLKGKRILLVEDEELNKMVAKHLLEKDFGAAVDIATNGKIAISMMNEVLYDLVIMDIQMPEMNGYDTTRYIRTKMPLPQSRIPILAMTAHAFKDEEIKCKNAGMNEFISKPIKIHELGQKLKLLFTSFKNT